MNIDFNKKVSELTPQEAIYLGDKAKGITSPTLETQPYVYQEYPKYIPELGVRVLSADEEKEAYLKNNEALKKANEIKPILDKNSAK